MNLAHPNDSFEKHIEINLNKTPYRAPPISKLSKQALLL